MTLDEIRSLMSLSDDGMCDVTSPELQRLLERTVAECDRQLAERAVFRDALTAAAQRLAPCAEDATCSAFALECACLPRAPGIQLHATT